MNTIILIPHQPVYFEIDPGETVLLVRPDGKTNQLTLVDLLSQQERRVLMTLDNQPFSLPFGRAADPRTAQPAFTPSTVIELDGLRLGGEVAHKFFQKNTRYELTFANLAKSMRLFVQPANTSLSAANHDFPVPQFVWNFADNWLQPTPYGLHLGIDLYAESGSLIVCPTDGYVLARRELANDQPEDLWGNMLAVAGNDGIIYLLAHCQFDSLHQPGQPIARGNFLGWLGNSGFKFTPILPHLHFGMLRLNNLREFFFEFEQTPSVQFLQHDLCLPLLPSRSHGFVINPYPYLLEWYQVSTG